MSAAHHRHGPSALGRRDDGEAQRRFWIALALAFVTTFGLAASLLALVAAGLALFG
jgi:hypothetical protein